MKNVTATKIRDILKNQWPTLRYIWLFDPMYMLLSLLDMKQILSNLPALPRFRYNIMECNHYALITHAFVTLSIAEVENNKYKYTAAFGQALISSPGEATHVLNLFITEDETIWLFDAQLEQTENPHTQTAHYVRI